MRPPLTPVSVDLLCVKLSFLTYIGRLGTTDIIPSTAAKCSCYVCRPKRVPYYSIQNTRTLPCPPKVEVYSK